MMMMFMLLSFQLDAISTGRVKLALSDVFLRWIALSNSLNVTLNRATLNEREIFLSEPIRGDGVQNWLVQKHDALFVLIWYQII